MRFLDCFCELLKNKLIKTNFIKEDDILKYKLKNINDNFFKEMSTETLKQYEDGDGKELSDGKMNMIRSSSAMIYNLLGNDEVNIKENGNLPEGVYKKEFEKRYKTVDVKVHGKQVEANLDAWLYNSKTEIFIESKCLEWIQNSHEKKLKKSYVRDIKKYFYKESGEVFRNIGHKISDSQYDSCQMFKHTLAIYNYLKDMNVKNKKIYLVNLVWEPNVIELPSMFREKYQKQLSLEHKEYADFHELMIPIINLISEDTENEFDIKYLSVKDFYDILEYSDIAHSKYIQRYL